MAIISIVKNRRTLLLLAQVAISLVTARWAVEVGIPYLALGPLTWWQFALRWPQLMAYGLLGSAHPLAVEFALIVLYSVMAFLTLRYLIVNPILRKRTT